MGGGNAGQEGRQELGCLLGGWQGLGGAERRRWSLLLPESQRSPLYQGCLLFNRHWQHLLCHRSVNHSWLSSSPHAYEVGTVVSSILQLGKLRHRSIKCTAQGHAAGTLDVTGLWIRLVIAKVWCAILVPVLNRGSINSSSVLGRESFSSSFYYNYRERLSGAAI